MPAPKIAQQWKALSLPWHLGLKTECIKNEEVPSQYAHISCYTHGCVRPQTDMLLHRSGFLQEHFCNSDRKKVGTLRISREYGENIVLGGAIADHYPNVHTLLIDTYNCFFEYNVTRAYEMKHLKRVICYGDPKLPEPIYSIASQFPQAEWFFVETGYEHQYEKGKFRDILMLMYPNLKGLCFYSSTEEREKWGATYYEPVRDLYETPNDWQSYEIVDFHDIHQARWSFMVYERKIDPWLRRQTLLNQRYSGARVSHEAE